MVFCEAPLRFNFFFIKINAIFKFSGKQSISQCLCPIFKYKNENLDSYVNDPAGRDKITRNVSQDKF